MTTKDLLERYQKWISKIEFEVKTIIELRLKSDLLSDKELLEQFRNSEFPIEPIYEAPN